MAMVSSIAKAIMNNKGTAFNVGMGAYFGVQDYKAARQEGAGKISAVGSAAKEAILPMLFSTVKGYMGFSLLTNVPEMLISGYQAANEYDRSISRQMAGGAFSTSEFNDTDQAYTMRQAGMAIAQRSRYNTQQAMLGNEAKYMIR